MIQIHAGGLFESRSVFNVYQTPLRVTTEYELEIYDSGDSFLMLNGVKYPHTEPALFLIPPGAERFSLGSFSCAFLHFQTDDKDLISVLSHIPPCLPQSGESLFRTRCLEIVAYTGDSPEERLRRSALLISFLLDIAGEASKYDLPPRRSVRYAENMLNVKRLIDEKYGEKLPLDSLASVAYLSKNFMRTLFSEQFELSPTEYLTRVRLSHAIDLFRTTGRSFIDIALSCGFGSQAYMNAVVKSRTGHTPSYFRKEAQKKGM